MEGEKHKKSKGKPYGMVDKTGKTATEGAIVDEHRECHGGRSQNTELTRAEVDTEGNIAAIREYIRNMATEMKCELGNFRNGSEKIWKRN